MNKLWKYISGLFVSRPATKVSIGHPFKLPTYTEHVTKYNRIWWIVHISVWNQVAPRRSMVWALRSIQEELNKDLWRVGHE